MILEIYVLLTKIPITQRDIGSTTHSFLLIRYSSSTSSPCPLLPSLLLLFLFLPLILHFLLLSNAISLLSSSVTEQQAPIEMTSIQTRNRSRNLRTSKALLKSQAHQSTSLFTSAETNQRGIFRRGSRETQVQFPEGQNGTA